jgi:hypothetical protein
MKNNLSLIFHYWSNYPIQSNWAEGNKLYMSMYSKIKNFNSKMCKNFIILIFFLRFFKKKILKNRSLDKIKYSYFIKPQKKNIFNYLRAPYKNKTSRNQLYTPRHKFSIKIEFFSKKFYTYSKHISYTWIIQFFKKNFICFESNIVYLNKLNILYKGVVRGFWNYKKIK